MMQNTKKNKLKKKTTMIVIEDKQAVKEILKEALLEIEEDIQKEKDSYKVMKRIDVAKRMGCSASKVKRLIDDGFLELTADGIYVLKRSVDEYVNKKNI